MNGYLDTCNKEECFGCEACKQICPKNAIEMYTDKEGFRYPIIDIKKCINCGMCRKVCSYVNIPERYDDDKFAFGGYHKSYDVRDKSTSGGFFSAIVDNWCDENYIIFGAKAEGLEVFHSYIDDKKDLNVFRKSKYSQSKMGDSYKKAKEFLKHGKKVLFSGTPCQIAGLRTYLGKIDITNLLTIEVICEGVPSPLYMRKYEEYIEKKYNAKIKQLDYRYTDLKNKRGKWDFQIMYTVLDNGKSIKKDRWFNPFWKIWLAHLMSRPSCYNCKFTNTSRVADISLGDLWGVHLYCPELYGKNCGASLAVCNTIKGKEALKTSLKDLYGHQLDFQTALKYQSPMRKPISKNPDRDRFMNDLENSEMTYKKIISKWYSGPSLKLLWSKYVWGNRQKIFVWNIKNNFKRGDKNGKNND